MPGSLTKCPSTEMLADRLAGVLGVVYLVFNEGYVATEGPTLIRPDLCKEGIRLARLLATLMPQEPEVRALLSLLLLTDARRAARTDPAGEPVLLPDQDRTRWDRSQIQEGLAELGRAGRHHEAGPYFLQAAIAAEHAGAERAEDTNWPRIVRLYDALVRLTPSPVARLNRLVAVSMASGPADCLPRTGRARGVARRLLVLPRCARRPSQTTRPPGRRTLRLPARARAGDQPQATRRPGAGGRRARIEGRPATARLRKWLQRRRRNDCGRHIPNRRLRMRAHGRPGRGSQARTGWRSAWLPADRRSRSCAPRARRMAT